MPSIRAALVVCVAVLGGCTTHQHRDVTPWWRVRGTYTPCLMAESGGGKGCTWDVRTERKTASGWQPVSRNESGVAFCAATRVADGKTLWSAEGPIAELPKCDLIAKAPDDRSAWCISITRHPARPNAGPSSDVKILAFDCNGRTLVDATALDPQPEPDDAKPFAYYSELSFVGFVDQQPLFQSKMNPRNSPTTCVAFAVDGHAWIRLGEMTPGEDALHRCRSSEDWARVLRRRVVDTSEVGITGHRLH